MLGRGELDDGYIPANYYRPALAASVVITGHHLLYGFTVFSSNVASQSILVFDSATLPAEAAVPIFAWTLAAGSGAQLSWTPQGREFLEGIVICNSSTATTKTIGSADCFFDVQYDALA